MSAAAAPTPPPSRRLEIETTIHYLVPITEGAVGNDYSPFQGFAWGLVERWPFLRLICQLPSDTFEFFWSRTKVQAARAHGLLSYSALLLVQRDLGGLRPTPVNPFMVVFSDAGTQVAVREWLSSLRIRPLHVSLVSGDDAVSPGQVSARLLYDHCRAIVQQIAAEFPPFRGAADAWLGMKRLGSKAASLRFPRTDHNIVAPNEQALESLGFAFRSTKPLAPTHSNLPYVRATVRAAKKLRLLRAKALRPPRGTPSPPMPDLIITTTSVQRHVAHRAFIKSILRKVIDKAAVRKALVAIARPRQFVVLTGPATQVSAILDSSEARALIDVRRRELFTETAGLCVRSSSQVTPTLRLEPDAGKVHSLLKQLGVCVRTSGPNSCKKSRRLVSEIVTALRTATPSEYVAFIEKAQNGVKLVSDLPLEWLPCAGLPLFLRQEVSRIPSTPGSLAMTQVLTGGQVLLPRAAFDEVLIVRGLLPNDRLYPLLRDAVSHFQRESSNPLQILQIDVTSRAELVSALNSFAGAVLVFDGHGVHRGSEDAAALRVGDEEVDVWTLRSEARIPPIVLTCACDTHALDGSHATSANGFLNAGARSVIATLLPVNGALSAILAARFIFRISDYLPAVVGSVVPAVRWSTVISLFFRMLFATEFVNVIQSILGDHSPTDFALIAGNSANTYINQGRHDWYERLLAKLSDLSSIPSAKLDRLRQQLLFLPECQRYVHLGNPESLVVYDDSVRP